MKRRDYYNNQVSDYEFGNKSLDVADNPVATMRGALHPTAVLGLRYYDYELELNLMVTILSLKYRSIIILLYLNV